MKRVLRWAGLGLGGLSGLVLLIYVTLYVLSEIKLRHTDEIPIVELSIPTDQASLIEGQRLAIVHGCFGGCHGQEAGGAVMVDLPNVARIVAPNLTTAVHTYNDAQLVAAIRHGLRTDGRSMIVMPSDAFIVLTDADLGSIIGFLKSLPTVAGWEPSVSLEPLGRIGVATGKLRLATQLIHDAVPPPEASEEQAAFGRYLARTTCAMCHGTSLRGDSNPDFTSPDLRMVGAYSQEQFAALMRTGTALGDRELRVMSDWSRQHLSYFTDGEIAALYDYLSHFSAQ